MKDWAEARAENGAFSNTSDYVRDLIRRDRERTDKITAMQILVDEACASGVGERSMAALLDEARARLVPDAL
ncbi:MAG: putative transcriptional regulator, CopG/Arc/MetJ family [Caulobacteraceae bacterium]|nr:putative transcriptional regulator, CopG/Arc/MetJ family [Caulobacteraceae bacterium]